MCSESFHLTDNIFTNVFPRNKDFSSFFFLFLSPSSFYLIFASAQKSHFVDDLSDGTVDFWHSEGEHSFG